MDSNQGPPPSEGGTLARLSYTQLVVGPGLEPGSFADRAKVLPIGRTDSDLSLPFRLSAFLSFHHPLGEAGIRPLSAPPAEHPGSGGAGGRARTCGRPFWRRRRPCGLTHAYPGPRILAPRPGFEPGAAGLTVRLPYPPGLRGIKKPRSFGRGSIANKAVSSRYPMESSRLPPSFMDALSGQDSARRSPNKRKDCARGCVPRYELTCFISRP